MNKFFDCLNARSQVESIKDHNEFYVPYTSKNDHRFDWLKNDFLGYLRNWKFSVLNRPGEFTTSDSDKMFLSHQTYTGLLITVHSVIEAMRFLLDSGMPYVLTERFNQDCLEEYLGDIKVLDAAMTTLQYNSLGTSPTLSEFNALFMFLLVIQVAGMQKKKKKKAKIMDYCR